MKRGLLALLAFAFVFLCGCDNLLQVNTEELLKPPQLTQEQAAIHTALIEAVGNDSVKLKYPKTGAYRSAFVLKDLNGDGVPEAIVFYDPQTNDANVRINVLVQGDEGWYSVIDIPGRGQDVDKVDFAQMADGINSNLIVGWSQTGSDDKSAAIYEYDDTPGKEKLTQAFNDSYSDMELYDVGHDGFKELLLISRNTVSRVASVKQVSYQEGNYKLISKVTLNENITDFAQIKIGMLDTGTEGMFIDSYMGPQLITTDVIAFVDGKLKGRISGSPEYSDIDLTRRQLILCEDIDSDGVVEIPYVTFLPGYEETTEGEKFYSTEYFKVEGDNMKSVWIGVVNVESGYRFEIPDNWDGRITVDKIIETGELRFSLYDNKAEQRGEELIRLRTLSSKDIKDRFDTGSYEKIAQKGIYEFYARANPAAPEEYRIAMKEIKARFSLLG